MIAAPPPVTPVTAFARVTQALASVDPFRARQYHLAQIGWTPQTSRRRPLVAVLDTGVDATHPDLRGVVDLARSRSFVGGAAVVDRSGHGTHVAGLIAARAGNGAGGVGVANARIVSIKVADSLGDADATSMVAGINYAVSRKVRVINISLGGTAQSGAEHAAINRAIRAGIVVVAAAGNGGAIGSPVEYPAGDAHVIAVGALTRQGARLASSTVGPQVMLAAPGQALWSTAPSGRYNTRSGTSVAAALVSGAAARLIVQRPTIRADQVAELLRASVTDLGHAGRDDQTGAGLLNLDMARRVALPSADRPEPDDDPSMVRTRMPLLAHGQSSATMSGRVRESFDPSDDARMGLRAGQRITVRVVGEAGLDPDLVMWKPGAPARVPGPAYVRDWAAAAALGPGGSETLTFTAPRSGIYTIEVRTAVGGGAYRLTITQ